MSLRCCEPGWVLCAMHDPVGRRGIWRRVTPDTASGPHTVVELCGGREGDDTYVRLEVGAVLTAADIRAVRDVLQTSRWMMDEAGLLPEAQS